jgi:ADP-heptose:LPS heptosyltransferase
VRGAASPSAAQSGWWRRVPYHDLVESSVRDQHTIDHYAALAGAGADATEPRLNIPADAVQKARRLCGPGDFALIHAGTARPEKYWLPERWARVIEHLHHQHGLPCILTGGSDSQERAHLAEIERASAAPVQNLAGKLDLLELAALVSEARLVMSVDTVVVHLAAAFQRPQVALFGPTNPFHWRPRHPGAIVFTAATPGAPLHNPTPRMKGAPMDQLSTDPIIRATDALLSAHGQSPKNLA